MIPRGTHTHTPKNSNESLFAAVCPLMRGRSGPVTDLMEVSHRHQHFVFGQTQLLGGDLLHAEGARAADGQLLQQSVLALHRQDLVADDLQQPVGNTSQ